MELESSIGQSKCPARDVGLRGWVGRDVMTSIAKHTSCAFLPHYWLSFTLVCSITH